MRKLFIITITSFALFFISSTHCCSMNNNSDLNTKFKIGVFKGNGGAESCINETLASITIDKQMEAILISPSDIANDILKSLDAIIIPGGSGSKQFQNMGANNRAKILEFINNGGAALGICAGAYFFSDTPSYACIGINGAEAIDIEHDNRGHGMAKFSLNELGKKIFPELALEDTSFMIYYEGPVFTKSKNSKIEYECLATMQSDVHTEGNAPLNMTNNKPFFIVSTYGKGKVFSSIAHPEATPGKMWMVPRILRYLLGLPLVEYSKEATTPPIRPNEILMSMKDLSYESSLFKILLYGSESEKIDAIKWLDNHYSWDAKTWVLGLIYDDNQKVKQAAAQYIYNNHYLHYLKDLKAAAKNETDELTKGYFYNIISKLEKIKSAAF